MRINGYLYLLGHEASGEVIMIGENVSKVKVGHKVDPKILDKRRLTYSCVIRQRLILN